MTSLLITSLAQRGHLEWIEAGGGRVAWRRFGTGAPLVLLHGGHGSWLHWVRNIDALSEAGHAVLVPDMPSFGDSDALAGDPHAADRLDRLVDALDLCCDALLGPAGHGSRRRPRAGLVDWRIDDRSAREAALRHNLAAHMIADPQHVDDLALAVHEASCLATRFRSKEISLKASLRDVLREVKVPVLAMFGEHDVTATPIDAIAALEQLNPRWRCVTVPDAGHWVQFERAASVHRELIDWFA